MRRHVTNTTHFLIPDVTNQIRGNSYVRKR